MSDEELMLAYRAGDERAHRALFDRLAPLLLGFARRHVGQETDAQDLVQHTFLQIHRARNDYRKGAKLRPWVFTIEMNLIRDMYRRRARRKETVLEIDGRQDPRFEMDALQRKEEVIKVRRALATLPSDQREAIEMHWLQQRPFAEIAVEVGASVSAVKVRAHRGYQKMRAWLETESPFSRS